jgi:hypothetical protein
MHAGRRSEVAVPRFSAGHQISSPVPHAHSLLVLTVHHVMPIIPLMSHYYMQLFLSIPCAVP